MKNNPTNIKSDNINKIDWKLLQNEMKNKFGSEIYDSWLKKIDLVDEFKNYVLLSVSTRFIRDWITSRYLDQILQIIKLYKKDISRIEFVINENIKNKNSDEIKQDNYSRAIELSNADFIKNSDEGDSKILAENGINLSGGQIQRIFIARAIYSNKNIIIFDESTNELDAKTENQIVDDILNLPQSVIFITHKEEIKDKFSRVIRIENK